MRTKSAMLAGVASFFLAGGVAAAQGLGEDGDLVTLTGVVNEVEDDSFTLDYGTGLVEVEFDGLFTDVDVDERLAPGERVTVYGEVDDDLFGDQEIEAETVYVRNRATVYGGDPALATVYYVDPYPTAEPMGTYIALEGEVVGVTGREFMLRTGGETISVDTVSMSYNPLDRSGTQQVREGDRVMVVGTLDDALFDETELSAELVYSMRDRQETNRDMAAQTAGRDRAASDRRRVDDDGQMEARDQRRASGQMAGGDRQMEGQQRRTARAEERSRDRVLASGRSGGSAFEEFDRIDANDDGVITEREYLRSVARVDNITRSEARRMFDAIARNDDEITRREFIRPSDDVQQVIEDALRSGA